MTFENFVPCQSNAQALSMARLVAEEGRSSSYSSTDGPLFIHGPAGTGKTHLLSAIANGSYEWKALLVNAGDLEEDYTRAVSRGTSDQLMRMLSDPQILLLDDIHLNKGYEEFQRELFSLIYQRVRQDRAVVLSSKLAPENLLGFDQRLLSLMQSGSAASLRLGGQVHRFDILQGFLADRAIPRPVVEYVAKYQTEDGHGLRRIARRCSHAPFVQRLLYLLGYRLCGARKESRGKHTVISSEWTRSADGRTPVERVQYFEASQQIVRGSFQDA
jgi:chromosomal replication initiator protein